MVRRWNGGVERGAASTLAFAIGVSRPTVNRWLLGRDRPKEAVRPKLAQTLGVSLDVLNAAIKPAPRLPDPYASTFVQIPEPLIAVLEKKKEAERSPLPLHLYITHLLMQAAAGQGAGKLVLRASGVAGSVEGEEEPEQKKHHHRRTA